MRAVQKKRLSTLLLVGAILFILTSFMLPVYAAETSAGSESKLNGYIEDIKIQSSTSGNPIPNYSFDKNTTSYDIDLYNSTFPLFTLSAKKTAVEEKNLYYYMVLDAGTDSETFALGTAGLKRITNATGTKAMPTKIPTLSCGKHTLSVRVGKSNDKKGFVDNIYDEYIYNFTLKPGFSSLDVLDEANKSSLSPKYTTATCYFNNIFSATTTGNKITLKGSFKNPDNKTSCYIGEALVTGTTANNSTTLSEEVDLSAYADENVQGVYKIPVSLVYNGGRDLRTENTIYVINTELAAPVIKKPAELNVECDKLDTPKLSVTATVPDGAVATYQWYSAIAKSDISFQPIAGATGSSYTIPTKDTSAAGTRYYRCKVTSTVSIDGIGEISFDATSDIFSVKTKLSYISKPNIFKELGSFVSTGEDKYADIYRTNYISGEKFDLMYISVQEPEPGVSLHYEYFVNTKPDLKTASPLEVVSGQAWVSADDQGNQYSITSVAPTEGFEEGVYYIYCTVTATADGVEPASETSGPVRLVYSRVELEGFTGSGTKENPYQLTSEADLIKLRKIVNEDNQWCPGVHFKMMNNIVLSPTWEPIGTKIDRSPEIEDAAKKKYEWRAFGGIFDGGGHKLTVATEGKPLFNFTSDATIKNLNIYGEKINGNGLIDGLFADYGADGNYWTGVPNCVTIQNVHLLNGSSTLRSGFMLGSGSGKNTITIEGCVVEDNVKIGYSEELSNIGSFVGGDFNGQINNSYSKANVYGKDNIGGLAGKKGQSMGMCEIRNSHFSGNLVATGDWVGGLIAKGYTDKSAPNTMAVSIINSYVDGNVTGADYVGGLFGGEGGLKQCWNECWIKDSFFYGTITATGNNVGGIIGYMRSIDKCQHIENNYFYEKSGNVTELIGKVEEYDKTKDFGFDNAALKAYQDNMGSAKTAEEFKNGTVKDLLNEGSDYKNWTQGENALYPTLLGASVVTRLDISGTYKTTFYLGEDLNLTGMKITAVYSDGKSVTVGPTDADVTITGYDKNKNEVQKLTISYKGATAEITVKVLKSSNITVYFTLLGDTVHDDGTTHTLADNNLTEWLPRTDYSVDLNATVLDVVQAAFKANEITFVNEKGNYISSVTYNDVTLTEKMNSAEMKSGWMYTLNGVHSGNAVNEQFLNSGDEIIFHWTDDYTKESSIGGGDKPTPKPGDKVTAEELAEAYKDTGDALALKTPGTGSIEGEWLMLGLARAEHTITTENRNTYLDAVRSYINARYKDGKLYDADFKTTVSTDNSRIILALSALGEDPQTFVSGKDLLKGYSDFDWVKKQGVNGTIWALIALDSNQYEIPTGTTTRDKLISEILSKQTTNGGWATAGHVADADMTAMAIQALAPYYNRADVKKAVDKALTLLSKTQNGETGAYFNSYNELSVESTAQVIVALTSLGSNPAEDDRFITSSGLTLLDGLMHFYNGSGEFKHTVNGQANAMATEQSYYALVSYYRHLNGKTPLYDMSDNISTPESVESVIEKIKAIPDPVDEDSYEAIVTAREAYEKLTDSEQEQVPQQYRNKLTRAETEYSVLLENAKSQAKSDLTDHYLSLKQEDYGDAGRKKLAEILSTGQKNITSAKSCKQVSTLLERAIKEMDEVKKGDMTVTFRLIGSLQATQDVNLTTDSYLPEYVTWIPTTKYELASNATVYDLFTEALSDAGLTSIGAESNYVKTIYAPSCLGGYALSEFTNGKNSGWMYTINGSHPNYGLKEQTLKDGDMVVWHYVNDYSHEVSDWNGGSQYPSRGDGTYYNGWLRAADITPERYVEQLLGKIVTVGKHGTVEPKLKLSDIGKSVTFTFKPDKGYRVKDVKVDGKSVGAVTTYKVDKLTVSTRIEVEFTNGTLPFTDVLESDWFYDDVAFAYENGLFAGTSDTTFSPNASMTRAMLVTVLYRLEGQPAVNGRSGFSDVQYNGYYEDAVTWAADNGIVNGTSITTFSPNANVTREQMAAILYRYAQYKKYNTAASSGLNGFTDHASVSGYAAASLEWAVAEKLVNGSAGKLMPTGNATRAQVAAILHRFVENVAKTTK